MNDHITKTFTKSELVDLLDDAEEIETAKWRHGRRVTYLLTINGDAGTVEYYRITLDVHVDEGIQWYGTEYTAERVEPRSKTITVWVPWGT